MEISRLKRFWKYHCNNRRLKTTESYQTSVIMVTHNLSSTSNTFVSLNRAVMGITRLYGLERCVLCVAVSGMDLWLTQPADNWTTTLASKIPWRLDLVRQQSSNKLRWGIEVEVKMRWFSSALFSWQLKGTTKKCCM